MFSIQDKAILNCQLFEAPIDISEDIQELPVTYYYNTLNSLLINYTPKLVNIGKSPLLIPGYVSKFYGAINSLAEDRLDILTKKNALQIIPDPIKWNPSIIKNFIYLGAELNLRIRNWSDFPAINNLNKAQAIENEAFFVTKVVNELTELKAVAYGLVEAPNIEVPAINMVISNLKNLCVDDDNKLIL